MLHPRCYERAQRRLMKTLEGTEQGRATITVLEHQHDLVTFLTKLAHDIKKMRDTRQRKVERLKAALTSTHSIMFANASAASPGKIFSRVALQQLYLVTYF